MLRTLTAAGVCGSVFCLLPAGVLAQQSGLAGGYILIAPMGSETAHLVSADQKIVHTWHCDEGPANATYLEKDGNLLRTARGQNPLFNARGGSGGRVLRFAWDGELLWDYRISDDTLHHHHDVEPMPNGNVLVIAWERHTQAEAIAAGRDPQTISDGAIWTETILEVKPVGKDDAEVVWKWRLWDHLIQQFDETKSNYGRVADHPERVDFNYGTRRGGADWIHMNSVDYNAELDQIALSARWFDEAWIIDHSTTTKEAAGRSGGRQGKGGDLLYRWGNPEAYYAGLPFDRQLFAQHDVRWIDADCPGAGNLLIFNNGDRQARNHSSVDEWKPPMNKGGGYRSTKTAPFGPETFTWSYSDPENFVSNRISGAQRLPNGNTLVCSGEQGWVFEVRSDGKRIWELDVADLMRANRGSVFRAPWYANDFSPAFTRLK